jgi:hypothetical protein
MQGHASLTAIYYLPNLRLDALFCFNLPILPVFLLSSMYGIAFHMRQQQLDHRNVRKRSGQINTSRQELDCGIDQFRFDHVIFLVVEVINMTAGLLQHLRCSDYLSLLTFFVMAENHCKPRRVRWPFLMYLIADMPSAAAYTTENVAPIHPTSSPAADIQAGLDIAWQTLFPIMPYIIGLAGLARVAWMATHKPTGPEYPVYTWALSTVVAAFWLAVRSRETEPAPVEARPTFDPEAIILVAFLSLWTSFVADSQRFVVRRALYLLLSVFIGGTAGLLIAALTLISEPRKVETRAVIMYECRASSLIPLTLSFATSVTYIFLRYCMDADFSVEKAQVKTNDGNIMMQDLEAGVSGHQDGTPIVDRDPINDTPQLGAVVPQVGPVWVGDAAAVENFTLDDSIDSDDGSSSEGDVGLMDISNPNDNAASSAVSRATGFEGRSTFDAY